MHGPLLGGVSMLTVIVQSLMGEADDDRQHLALSAGTNVLELIVVGLVAPHLTRGSCELSSFVVVVVAVVPVVVLVAAVVM